MPLRRRAADADRHTFELVDAPELGDELDGGPDDLVVAPPRSGSDALPPRSTGGDDRVTSAAVPDGGPADGGPPDGGPTDGGPTDGRPPDDGPPDGPAGVGAVPPVDPAARAAARRRGRRVVLASVAAAAVVLGGMATVDAVVTRGDRARLSTAQGGIASAAQAPQVVWEIDDFRLGEALVAYVPGAAVVSEGDEAVAYDLETGTEAWRRTFDEATFCGGVSAWWSGLGVDVEDSLVCVPMDLVAQDAQLSMMGTAFEGGDAKGEVTVLAPDGSVLATRDVDREVGPDPGSAELADVRWNTVMTGPDGGVLWIGRAGPEPQTQGDLVPFDPESGMPEGLEQPSDVVVAVQDVDSGAVRWHTTEAASADLEEMFSCVQWQWEGQAEGDMAEGDMETAMVDLDQAFGSSSAGLVSVQGCGLTATFASDGTRLDDPDDPEVVADQVLPFGEGYLRDPSGGAVMWGGAHAMYDGSGDPLNSTVLDADGAPVWEATGLVLPPMATDGGSALWFALEGLDLVAVDHRGERQWSMDSTESRGGVDRLLVATRDVVVVSTAAGISALDASTGRVRWALDGESDVDAPRPQAVQQVFTDGRSAVFVTDDGGGPRLAALDLADGRVVWTTDADSTYWTLVAVDGKLLRFGESTFARLG